TEEAFTHALLRLLQRDTQFIAFVTGHGERSPFGQANFDLGHWHEVLKARGYRVQELNLAELTAVPDNTALVVMASPQLDYLPGEITLILDYVARGGNLLWLAEPDLPRSLDTLAKKIGFERLAATVVDPVASALGIDNPAFAIVTRYPAHPALRGLSSASVFPYATPLAARATPGWRASRLLETGAKAWGETAAMRGTVTFDPDNDYRAPLALGLALTRSRSGGEQRLVMLGDGDFLSNTYIGNSGNQDLGTRLVDWLAMNEAMIEIETRLAPDVSLDLARWQQAVIGIGFLVVLPLAFALNGILIGWRRHHA
ncbi:MAG: GldG family protein, partial [Gammaproteobacteria bacterium]